MRSLEEIGTYQDQHFATSAAAIVFSVSRLQYRMCEHSGACNPFACTRRRPRLKTQRKFAPDHAFTITTAAFHPGAGICAIKAATIRPAGTAAG